MAEKILNSYETIFIIDATLDEENVTALKDKFVSLIEKNGELESVDEWGKRKNLCYHREWIMTVPGLTESVEEIPGALSGVRVVQG